jgi:deoxyadenosine/deoxycytidine kinase
LRQYYKDNANVLFLREPVDEWEKIKDTHGVTMLQKFYENQEKYSFAFQMMAYISRLKLMRQLIAKITTTTTTTTPSKYIIITERSLHTDKYVFAKMLYDQGKIEDICYQIYLNWFSEFAKDYPVSCNVYVNTLPTKCHERIHQRSRTGEDIIPLEYLQECHNYHEAFLNDTPEINNKKIVLDGNVNVYENAVVLNDWLEQINAFINELKL